MNEGTCSMFGEERIRVSMDPNPKTRCLVLGSLATVRQRHIKLTASRAPRAGAEQRQERQHR